MSKNTGHQIMPIEKLERYATKLLFQFRVVINGESNKRRTTEERIIILREKSAKNALKKAKRRGRKEEYHYKNNDENTVYFEFVGITELMHLGVESDDDEVWYEIKEYLLPMERKEKLIPSENQLSAIRNESERSTSGLSLRST